MDLNLPGTSSKNQKISEGEDITGEVHDRISKLPVAILCRILSFLPTKFAAQTGILSKQWKDLWLLVPTLDFDMHLLANYKGRKKAFDRFAKSKMESFTNFVDRLLAIRDTSSIKKFRLACDQIDSRCLKTWLCAVRNVEELDLEIWELNEFPWNPFVGNSLVILKLKSKVLLDIPSNVSFCCLKILHLDLVTYVDDASVEKLLSCCPVLEDLQISRTYWDKVWNFVIAVPSLKRLIVDFGIQEMDLYNEDDSEGGVEYKLFIDAPNLEYLSLVDYFSDLIQVHYVECVTESHISVNKILEADDRTEEQISNYGNNVCGIFRSIPNVKCLKVGDFTMGSLSDAVDRSLPIYYNLVHLEITLDGVNAALLLPTFLEISPKLKSLILPQGITNPAAVWFNSDEGIISYHWKAPENVPECLLLILKKVEIGRITGKVEEELNLVRYLLENAMVLEKMTIVYEEWLVSGGPLDNTSYPAARRLDDRITFRDKLMNWVRGSDACQLDIQFPEVPL